jgi:polyadenylation factor subunit 2
MASSLPLLLPPKSIPTKTYREWTPKNYMAAPQPPLQDDSKMQEMEMAAARHFLDGKTIKKTRPRRTVDYNGGLGRWALVSPNDVW